MNVPSPSQLAAIEADARSLLVLAGPGAGKTYCLTERIRFLIERHGFDPARICAFTFTNKAAGEIAHRLEARLGAAAGRITSGTLHAFCAALLRTHGSAVGLGSGFGIADEEYQLGVLRRLQGHRNWHRKVLTQFSAHRFCGVALEPDDQKLFERYERFLAKRNLVDYDLLILRAADLLERTEETALIRGRWDVILVDEFQDLNRVQYRIVRALAHEHRHVFAVGDHEQSIYSWAGADRIVFENFVKDFGSDARLQLEDNRRCPQNVFAHARTLVENNPPIFQDRVAARANRISVFPVRAVGFATEDDEAAWVIADLCRDRDAHGHQWGDIALLYRKHEIGERLEASFINANIPCRLAQGRALGDDPAVAYVLAAVRVIARPDDSLIRDGFFRVTLPRHIFDEARAQAEASRHGLRRQLDKMVARLPKADPNARKIWRALYDWRNLAAAGKRHESVGTLVQELLSRRVGVFRSALEERHDEITDPASLPDVVQLASRLRSVRDRREAIWLPPLGGSEIGISGMLQAVGIHTVRGAEPTAAGVELLDLGSVPSVGLALGVFKAAQLMEMSDATNAFSDYTAVDLETTDRDTETAEIIDMAAVRVRGGRIVEQFSAFVRPRVQVSAGAAAVHQIDEADLASAPYFEDVWPAFRAFCGEDIIVAHNGYMFDFPILARMVRALGQSFDLSTYDTLPLARDLFPTSRKLGDLARQFGISTGQAHRALDDSLALAEVMLELDREKLARARKTALVNLLDNLGIALALGTGVTETDEHRLFRELARPYSLGRFSHCLERYEEERRQDESLPDLEDLIARLGGRKLMLKIRAEKTADQRYPAAMARLRRLIAGIPESPLNEQLGLFLERAALSKWDGLEPERERVNLLTLHSTKGLEFSRVYIVGAEDGQLPGNTSSRVPATEEVEEARRLLYVGMTRTIDRLVLTRAATRGGRPTGEHQFLDDMDLALEAPE